MGMGDGDEDRGQGQRMGGILNLCCLWCGFVVWPEACRAPRVSAGNAESWACTALQTQLPHLLHRGAHATGTTGSCSMGPDPDLSREGQQGASTGVSH